MDQIFKQKLYDHESPVRKELWDRIETGLDKPVAIATKRTKAKWITGIILLLFLSTCAYIAIDHPLLSGISDQNIDPQNPSSADYFTAIDSKEDQPSDNNTNQIIQSPTEIKQSFESNSIDIASPELPKTSNSDNRDIDVYDVKEVADAIEAGQTLVLENNPIFEKDESVSNLSTLNIINQLNESATIANLYSQLQWTNEFDDGILPDKIDCPPFGENGKPVFFLEPYLAHDYAARTLRAKETEMEGYLRLRDGSESSLYSIAAGLRASMVFGTGYTIKTGLVYTQINERFNFEDPDAQQTRTIITIDTIWNNGVPMVTVDTSYLQIGGTQIIRTFNKYRMIDIPLILGYEMHMGRYNLSINAGAYFNVAFSQKGRFLSPMGDPVDFSSGSGGTYQAFKTSLGISLYGSIAAYYTLTDNLDLMIEPRVRYYLNPISLDSYPLEQSYVTYGLITGLRYKF